MTARYTMSEPLDPATITAQHKPGRRHYCCGVWRTATPERPCLPYRMAVELSTVQEREHRVRGEIERLERIFPDPTQVGHRVAQWFRAALDAGAA